jgi:hypothetical protein
VGRGNFVGIPSAEKNRQAVGRPHGTEIPAAPACHRIGIERLLGLPHRLGRHDDRTMHLVQQFQFTRQLGGITQQRRRAGHDVVGRRPVGPDDARHGMSSRSTLSSA